MGYLANFLVYTLAMVGVIVVALLVFKNATSFGSAKSSKYLNVVDSMQLGPRKSLYIVSAGSEKFLIASDADKTNLISKLDFEENSSLQQKSVEQSISTFKETIANLPKKNYMDRSDVAIRSSILTGKPMNSYKSVIKNLADKLE